MGKVGNLFNLYPRMKVDRDCHWDLIRVVYCSSISKSHLGNLGMIGQSIFVDRFEKSSQAISQPRAIYLKFLGIIFF